MEDTVVVFDVERVVLISLERRGDRRDAFWGRLPGDWGQPLPYEVMAVDGRALPVPPQWRDGAGAYGCALSHASVLREALDAGVRSLLVLEDDAVLARGFTRSWDAFFARVPGDWRLVMFGGQHVAAPTPIRPGVVRCLDTRRTHAYLVRGEGLPILHRAFSRATGHVDQHLGFVQRRVPTYAPDPFLVGQASGRSDVHGHDEPQRWWSGPRIR